MQVVVDEYGRCNHSECNPCERSMAPIDKFERAIIEFGVKEALEYFGTPESIHHLWNERWEKNVISKTT